MGACLSCCEGAQRYGPDSEAYRIGTRTVDTEADRRARAAAAEAAAQRQERYNQSAVGKAVAKSVRAAKPDQRYNDKQGSGPTTQDWLN